MRLRLNNTSSLGYELTLAETLFSLGARPPVVCAVCPIGKKTAIRLYKTIHQRLPKQGMLPYDPYWIIRSSVNDIHASIFLGLIHDLSQQQSPVTFNAALFITAYELYCQWWRPTPSPASWKRVSPKLFC
jgi:flagellar transcriptional activator FlhC